MRWEAYITGILGLGDYTFHKYNKMKNTIKIQ